MSNANFDTNLETGELTITRTINAPVEKVWKAYTTPEIFKQWWGPRGWETTVKECTIEPGGTLLYGMKCVDENQGEWFGKESWGKMVFKDINEPTNFSYTDYFCDENGVVDETLPAVQSTMQFEAVDGGTKLVNTNTYASGEALKQVLNMGMEQGISETFDRLEELLGQQE